MELNGYRLIAAPREDVWRALNDPEVLKVCIPGCQDMEKTSATTFVATVKQKVGPVNATFRGSVELTDIVEGESYRIVGEGTGGAAGFAKGGAAVRLEEVSDGTKLTYETEAKVGGKLAQLGSRLIDSFARKMANQFFDSFKRELEPQDEPEEPATPSAVMEEGVDAETASGADESEDQAGKERAHWFKRIVGR